MVVVVDVEGSTAAAVGGTAEWGGLASLPPHHACC